MLLDLQKCFLIRRYQTIIKIIRSSTDYDGVADETLPFSEGIRRLVAQENFFGFR